MSGARTGDHRKARVRPILNLMSERGSQLLEAHIRSFDPSVPTARERLAEALGESLAKKLLFALSPSH